MTGSRPRVLAIVGPTGSGKTDVAAEVARRTGAEVVSADSMQVYRGMDIGTAKASLALRAEIPHHLIDVVDPDDFMSAGRYAGLARAAAREIAARGRPVILCGGSGLYTRAFAGGLIRDLEADPPLRAELRARPLDELLAELAARDPESAARIPRNDRVRIERALEVARQSGQAAAQARAAHGFADRPFDVRWLGLALERDLLRERLAARTAQMFADGLVEEVRALRAAGYPADLRPLQSVGYLEVGQLLDGQFDEREARARVTIATQRLAKRQRTWFRAEASLEWVDVGQGAGAAVERALAQLGG
jgi:tRNA dimethylallyltransferase